MAQSEGDGISSKVIVLGGLGALVLFGGGMFASSFLAGDPSKPERITLNAIEPAAAPPASGELAERIRSFFMKGGVEECLERHLGHESRVEGTLAIELWPEGTTRSAEVKTEPQNGGVALCLEQKFARGFAFQGPRQKVFYTFSARWDSTRLALSQNVTSSGQ